MDHPALDHAAIADGYLEAHLAAPDVTFASPAHKQAWDEFRGHPATAAAQATFDARMLDLQPLRDAHLAIAQQLDQLAGVINDKITQAQIDFQADASIPMIELTGRLHDLAQPTV